MLGVSGLTDTEFNDIEDLGQVSKSSKVKAKLVKFFEKYGDDSSPVPEHKGWESSEYSKSIGKRYLRYREKN